MLKRWPDPCGQCDHAVRRRDRIRAIDGHGSPRWPISTVGSPWRSRAIRRRSRRMPGLKAHLWTGLRAMLLPPARFAAR